MRRPHAYMSSNNGRHSWPYGGPPPTASYPMSPYASYPPYPAHSYPPYPYMHASMPVPVTPGSYPDAFADPSQFNRKRQRRQAAGVAVQSLFSNNMGRKSTAQPRPVLNVPPRGIGPISDPNENDVLSGRGGRINSHPGNVRFRDIIANKKKEYLAPTTKKLEKAHIAAAIVNDIRHMTPPGRFLKEDADTGLWWDIGDAKAIKKTGQALREDAPDIRPDIDGDSDGEHGEDGKKSPKADKPKAAAKKSPPKVKKEPISPKSNSPMPQNNQQGQRQTSMGQTIATAQIPLAQPQFQQNMMAGPQHVPGPGGWQQPNPMMSQMDYQAQQMAMPPPYVQQPNVMNNFQQQQVPMQNNFQQQNMQMQQAPANQGFVQGMTNFPNSLYSGARSVGGRVAAASKQAMNVLGQSSQVPDTRTQAQRLQDEMAFGRTFHPPAAVMNSDNTMSEISGLSDPLSGISSLESGAKGSALSNFSGLTKASAMSGQQKVNMMSLGGGVSRRSRSPKSRQRDSLRLSQVGRSGVMSALGQMGSSRMSELTLSNRSLGGMSRSHSFPDMSSVMDGEAWNAIVEGDELMEASVTSGNSGRASMTSGRMSIMSLGSENSSSRWLANLKEMDDGKSYLSEMSSDLNALDLARDSK